VRWAMASSSATSIHPEPGVSTEDHLLRWVITESRARGLRVFLMPTIELLHRRPGAWRGTLAPTDWDAWWHAYARFVLHYAVLSEALGVDLFSVGSELLSTEPHVDRWRALITQVRNRFSGRLTYSANWDHFEAVAFWDALDAIGVTGYQVLSRVPDPAEEALARGFLPLRRRLDALVGRVEKPFIFTEVGYAARAGAAARPWDYVGDGAPDAQLQLRCYRALFLAWHDHPWLGGLYAWNWFGPGGPQDSGYTPRGKPAAAVLHHWYAGRSP